MLRHRCVSNPTSQRVTRIAEFRPVLEHSCSKSVVVSRIHFSLFVPTQHDSRLENCTIPSCSLWQCPSATRAFRPGLMSEFSNSPGSLTGIKILNTQAHSHLPILTRLEKTLVARIGDMRFLVEAWSNAKITSFGFLASPSRFASPLLLIVI